MKQTLYKITKFSLLCFISALLIIKLTLALLFTPLIIPENKGDCNAIIEELSSVFLSVGENPAKKLSENNFVKWAIRNQNIDSLDNLNFLLEGVKNSLDADVVYLMDRTGLVISSSEVKSGGTFLGQNYAFRPYFTNALSGSTTIYPALGVTTNKRGIYFSAPVQNDSGEIGAVVVIKLSIDHIESILQSYPYPLFLVSEEQVIFATNRPELLYYYILPINSDTLNRIHRSKQFGSDELRPFIHIENNASINYDGKKYTAEKTLVKQTGWSLIKLDTESLSISVNMKYIPPLILIAIMLILILILYLREFYYHSRRRREFETNKTLFTNLFSLAPDAICISTKEGKILLCNESFSALFKYTTRELYSMNIEKLYADAKVDRPRLIHELDRKNLIRNYPLVMKNRNNELIKTSNSIVYIDYEGKQCIEAVIRNVTDSENKKRELRKVQKRELVGIMSSGLAHDFNNILAAINASASLIRFSLQEGKNGETEDIIETIEQAVEKGSLLIRRVTSLAHREEGIHTTIDLNKVIQDIYKIFKKTVPPNITTTVSPFETAASVKGDPVQIEQVLLNIFINASHAMSIMQKKGARESGTLHISITKVEEESITRFFSKPDYQCQYKYYFCIAISDTGVGIPKALQHRIFDPFFTTKESSKGSGLGLSMVAEIIEDHNGLIRLESETDQGTTFFIYLPSLA
ncbi:MAG: ATP-binding protein [Spirochaetes bacterium]|nr:ATP-binding protein [Spirochaetota bacterium]